MKPWPVKGRVGEEEQVEIAGSCAVTISSAVACTMLELQATSRKLTPWSIRSWVTIAFCALSERLSRVSTSTLYLPAMPPAALISSIATAKPSITGESDGGVPAGLGDRRADLEHVVGRRGIG